MNQRFNNKKVTRGRIIRYNQSSNIDIKNNFKSQDHYLLERRSNFSDTTFYNIARLLMGNEVVIVTRNERVEGVFRGYDSTHIWLSQVFVYDLEQNESFSFVKNIFKGKDVRYKDILWIKVINTNGKIVNQEISPKKLIIKSTSVENKIIIPYYKEHLREEDDIEGDPDYMPKVNTEICNVNRTIGDTMEVYIPQIDRSDLLLHEKHEEAERLKCKIENDVRLRRVKLSHEDRKLDEEIMFKAAVPSVSPINIKVDTSFVSAQLNPNAPEFRPRSKSDTCDNHNILEEISLSNLLSVESVQHQIKPIDSIQQHIIPLESAQHQRLSLQFKMTPHTMATQQCSVARFVNEVPQWTVTMNSSSSGQYIIQQYLQHGKIIPPMFQTRQIAPEETQNMASGLFYSLGPLPGQFFLQSDQSSVINDVSQHHPLYVSSLDIVPAQIQQQLRHYLMPTNIPVVQVSPHQFHPQTFYAQPSHNHSIMNASHANFPQLTFNPQLQNVTATIQGYLPPKNNNGRP